MTGRACRWYLSHPNSARSIELIKRELAKQHAEDEDAYHDIKDPVYDLIWDAASDWSRRNRISSEKSDF